MVTFVLTRDSMVCASTIDADPVKELFVAVPYAITIVSSRLSVSGSRAAFSIVLPSIGDSIVLYPIDENTRIPSPGTVIVNSPSASVLTPVMVPSRWTDAYGTGSFVDASVTLPFTVRGPSWADAAIAVKAVRSVKMLFIIHIR